MTYAYGYIAKGHFAVTRKLLLRTYCNQVNLRTAYQYQKIRLLRCLEESDENVSDDIQIDIIVENEHISQIIYIPVFREWQKDTWAPIHSWKHGTSHYTCNGFSGSLSIFQPELFLMVIAFFKHFHFHLLVHRTIIKKFAYWLQPHD